MYLLIGEDLNARLALDRERFSSCMEQWADARAALAHFIRELRALDYVPGDLGLADGLLRADIEMLDATLLQAPRRSRQADVFLELAALLRLLADEEFAASAAAAAESKRRARLREGWERSRFST